MTSLGLNLKDKGEVFIDGNEFVFADGTRLSRLESLDVLIRLENKMDNQLQEIDMEEQNGLL
jgi:hypothetical protein